MAASLENYSGGTFLSDLVARPEFLAYTSEGIFEQSKWIQSGIIQRNAALDARSGGTRVRVPFFDPIAPTETQILSTSSWNVTQQMILLSKDPDKARLLKAEAGI